MESASASGIQNRWAITIVFYGVPEYLVVVALISLVGHLLIPRYLIACAAIVVFSSAVNLIHEFCVADFDFKMRYVSFLFVFGCWFATPIAMVTGLAFLLPRAWRRGIAKVIP